MLPLLVLALAQVPDGGAGELPAMLYADCPPAGAEKGRRVDIDGGQLVDAEAGAYVLTPVPRLARLECKLDRAEGALRKDPRVTLEHSGPSPGSVAGWSLAGTVVTLLGTILLAWKPWERCP